MRPSFTRLFLHLFIVLSGSACSTVRHLPQEADSTRVEIRTEIRTVTDTAWLTLPVFDQKVATLDTVSRLENKYARSEASVTGGVLSHSLATKPVREPVPVEIREIVRDSIVYRDRVVTETVEVEKPLTRWQRLKMAVGEVLLVVSAATLLLYIVLLFTHFNPKAL